jgi:hypothetical protein
MKKLCFCLASLVFTCSALLGQAQPASKAAPAKAVPQNGSQSVPEPSVISPPPVPQRYDPASVSTGHYYTPATNGGGYYYSPAASESGQYYTPAKSDSVSGNASFYSPTSSGKTYCTPSKSNYTSASGGYYYTPQGSYYSGSGSYYTATNGSYYSGEGSYYSGSGSYYSPTNGSYYSGQGSYYSGSGIYYTPQNEAQSQAQSRNVTPRIQLAPNATASSLKTVGTVNPIKSSTGDKGLNTSLTASAANSLPLNLPNLTDLLIPPVEGIKMGADETFQLYSDDLGVLGFGLNEFYKNAEAQFSDPNLQQKVDQLKAEQDKAFAESQAKQKEYWNTVAKGLDDSNAKLQSGVNAALGKQTDTVPPPAH